MFMCFHQRHTRVQPMANTEVQPKFNESNKHIHKRLPLNTWIEKMNQCMIECLNKFEAFNEFEWRLASNKIGKMMESGVPYRSANDMNFRNALCEVDALFQQKYDMKVFSETILSYVNQYARSKRRKAMEEIAFVLIVAMIQPQLTINESL